ncbi:MAG: ABC transporter ATP-binding protein [Bacillota bacterium]
MLEVIDLNVNVDGEEILKGVSLKIPKGETHILLGPNGSGKTTLLKAIMGMGTFQTTGRILLDQEDLTGLPVDERARRGIGIALQKSPVVPEVTLGGLLEMIRKKNGNGKLEDRIEALNCNYLLNRGVNQNFSGGEMKRSEMLQLIAQNPKLVLVDEPESGVDLDNVAVIGEAFKSLIKPAKEIEKSRSALVITHTGRIMEYLNADRGYVLVGGRIVCAGNPWDLFEEVNRHGFEGCLECRKFSCEGA